MIAGNKICLALFIICSFCAARTSLTDTLPQNMTADQLRTLQLSNRVFTLIDVRTATEAASGMIPGAYNIDWYSAFQGCLAQFSKTKDIVLYCASGNRAGQARSYLLANGFDTARVVNFGAFSKWSNAGLPISYTPLTSNNGCVDAIKNSMPLAPAPRPAATHYQVLRLKQKLRVGMQNGTKVFDIKGREIKRAR